jgi:hypothetical protein
MGDGLAGALHHERQRHDMGLTIHYQLTTPGDEAHARKLVQHLHQAALDLPFQHVGEIVELRGDQCDYTKRADDDPYRWLLVQAGSYIALPVSPSEKRQGVTRHLDVRPLHIIAFETEPGDGCEQANFGLCQYPGEVSDPGSGRHLTKMTGWSWHSFCKTHYASDPRCGGLPNFLRCHLGVVALLDEAKRLGCLTSVSDEGDFWDTRSLERLTKEIGDQSAMLAGRVNRSLNSSPIIRAAPKTVRTMRNGYGRSRAGARVLCSSSSCNQSSSPRPSRPTLRC